MAAPTAVVAERLKRITVAGDGLKADVVERVLAASLELSATAVSQLTLTLTESPSFTLLRSGLFTAPPIGGAGSRLEYGAQEFEVRAVELGDRGADHVLTVTARSRGACRMAREYGPLVRKGLSPTQFAKQQARRHGLDFVGQPSAERKVISRRTGQDRESTWSTIGRLAEDLGYLAFEAHGVLYFGRPEWLARHDDDPVRVVWPGSDFVDKLPTCRRTGDSKRKKAAEVDLELRGDTAETMHPGQALTLKGVPTYEGRYLVNTVTVQLGTNGPVSVNAATPENPDPSDV